MDTFQLFLDWLFDNVDIDADVLERLRDAARAEDLRGDDGLTGALQQIIDRFDEQFGEVKK